MFPANFAFRPADLDGARYIFERPRETELEIAACSGLVLDPGYLAQVVVGTNQATIVRIDGEPSAIWFWHRISDLQIEIAVYATANMLRYPIAFTRGAKMFLAILREKFPRDQILTQVSLGPHTSRFWLHVVGFKNTGEVIEYPGGPVEYMVAS